MKKIALALTLAAAASIMAPLAARATDDCSGQIGGFTVTPPAGPSASVPTLSRSVFVPVTDANKGPLYLDIRYLVGGQTSGSQAGTVNLFSIWVYEETNGVNGLQRGGHSIFPDTPATSGQDPCDTGANHDQDIF